jgi:hypothetical protein
MIFPGKNSRTCALEKASNSAAVRMITLALIRETMYTEGSVARNLVRHSLMMVIMLRCDITCSLTGKSRISMVLAAFSLVVGFQVTSWRFWMAMAADGGILKPPIVVDGECGAAAIIENDENGARMPHVGILLRDAEHKKPIANNQPSRCLKNL